MTEIIGIYDSFIEAEKQKYLYENSLEERDKRHVYFEISQHYELRKISDEYFDKKTGGR